MSSSPVLASSAPTVHRPGSPGTAYVDLAAIEANVRTLREHAPTAALLAVVKADAYGHGLVPSARAARRGGATWLGTAQLDEALALREAGVDGRVLSWLHVPGADFAGALERDIDLGVYGAWDLAEIAAAARSTGRPARIHLKVDTGLGRGGALGAGFTDLLTAARRLEAEGAARVVGVWSHFAYADQPDHPTVRHQQEVFEAAVREAEQAGCDLEVRHLANSAATLTNPSCHYDLVRPGLAVFGLSPVPQLGDPAAYGLTPAMRLVARLALVKDAPAGQGVSYGHQHTTTSATRLGLVPLGYADGVPRAGTNVGPVLADGRRTTIAGRVCMDQVVLDLGPDSSAQPGDEVVLFGSGVAGEPTAEDWAAATGTISYEIVTRLGPRVERVHLGDPAGLGGRR
ncbi:MAG TPA: alanine racemase [Dermatophilaceae bacterium]|nr:alanine racemase [Dermatophilaceae bacterium]